MPAFIIATDLRPDDPGWPAAISQAGDVRTACGRILGFDPEVSLAWMPVHAGDAEPPESLRRVIEHAARDVREIFVIPGSLDFSLWQRDALGQLLAEARREHPDVAIHHDDVDLGHPLLLGLSPSRRDALSLSPTCQRSAAA